MQDLGRGLKELLEYEGDVEEDLCQTFQVGLSNRLLKLVWLAFSPVNQTLAILPCFLIFFCDNFVASFWQISVGFRCIWPIKIQSLRGGVVISRKANIAFDNSASHSLKILIGQLKQKPSKGLEKR